MERTELKERLDKIVCQIKANSKDAHFANKLIDEALSLKGQLSITPTLVYVPAEGAGNPVKGNTFSLVKASTGEIVYKIKGGFTIVVDERMQCLHSLLDYWLNLEDEEESMTEEEKKNVYDNMNVVSQVLSLPIYVFTDLEFAQKIATLLAEFFNTTYERLMKQAEDELPNEDSSLIDMETMQELAEDAHESVKDLKDRADIDDDELSDSE